MSTIPDPAAPSKLAAALLGFFFGMFGAHRFYLGYTRRGLIMLSITIVGGILTLGLAALAVQLFSWYESIMYLTGQPRYTTDASGRTLRA
jgi:TM2 domain-containing membrane protein YozV